MIHLLQMKIAETAHIVRVLGKCDQALKFSQFVGGGLSCDYKMF